MSKITTASLSLAQDALYLYAYGTSGRHQRVNCLFVVYGSRHWLVAKLQCLFTHAALVLRSVLTAQCKHIGIQQHPQQVCWKARLW